MRTVIGLKYCARFLSQLPNVGNEPDAVARQSIKHQRKGN